MGEIRNEILGIEEDNLYTLMPLVVFKGLAGIDDRFLILSNYICFFITEICTRLEIFIIK